jgi:hypothetical protein
VGWGGADSTRGIEDEKGWMAEFMTRNCTGEAGLLIEGASCARGVEVDGESAAAEDGSHERGKKREEEGGAKHKKIGLLSGLMFDLRKKLSYDSLYWR